MSTEPATRPDGWPYCPMCGADELMTTAPAVELTAAALGPDRLLPYLAHGVRCLRCGHADARPPLAVRESPTTWLVLVAEALQDTPQGRLLAIRRIPFESRRRIIAYRRVDEVRAGIYRWWRFAVSYDV